jgi:hypothetical protein
MPAMRRWQRPILALVIALAAQAALARPVAACSCVDPGPPSAAFTTMPVVFVGTVTSVRSGANLQSWIDTLRAWVGMPPVYFSGGVYADLSVTQAWKGQTLTAATVVTGGSGASCGLDFQLQQDYLIYAWPDTYGLTTNMCTRSAPVSTAAADLAFLQTQPTLALTPAPGAPLPAPLLITGAVVALGLLGGGAWWLARRRTFTLSA